MKRLLYIFVLLFCCSVFPARGNDVQPADSLDGNVCLHQERAHLRFPGSTEPYDNFLDKLNALIYGKRKNVSIWHIGASHVQGGTFSNTVREDFANLATGIHGNRGFLFPMKLASTNQESGYSISADGKWSSTLMTKATAETGIRYGITGFAATTSDPKAKVFFDLGKKGKGVWSFNKVRVLGYTSNGGSAAPTVYYKSQPVRCTYEKLTESYLFSLPEYTDTLSITFDIPEGQSFTLTGIQPISSSRHGVSYYSSGVNGSTTKSWVEKAIDLERDLGLIKPDLCIIGLGINDSAGSSGKFKVDEFKDNIRELIREVRHNSPSCAFVFITTNDCYYFASRGRMAYNSNAPLEQQAMYDLAKEFDGAVWDLYDLMGGEKSVNRWKANGLMSDDRLHFNAAGYKVLGDALFNALIEGTDDLD